MEIKPTNRRNGEMENYQGVVQNVVMIGEGEYRVTFKAYNGKDIDTALWENEDVPYELYSLIARRRERGFAFIAEGRLTDCISVRRENTSVDTVPREEVDKWEIGEIANGIVSSLADNGMFEPLEADCEE
jgi:hypothetical protein